MTIYDLRGGAQNVAQDLELHGYVRVTKIEGEKAEQFRPQPTSHGYTSAWGTDLESLLQHAADYISDEAIQTAAEDVNAGDYEGVSIDEASGLPYKVEEQSDY